MLRGLCLTAAALCVPLVLLPDGASLAASRSIPDGGPQRSLSTPAAMAGAGAASRDTIVLYGGPSSWDGRFEDENGAAHWHGWLPVDYTAESDTLWNVSTFNAEALNGNGPGNQAMWCGGQFPSGPGYGNNFNAHLLWTTTVADTGVPTDVTVHAFVNHDTEPGFDQLKLRVQRALGWQDVLVLEGWRIDREIQASFTVYPQDYQGNGSDEIRLRWSFLSDGIWSDEDGLYLTDGGAQIDDISVHLGGVFATFDDFEGVEHNWTPDLGEGAGAFAHLAERLQDIDPCVGNSSWQVCFVDDGVVVPGTGGSPCQQWCYGPGGYVLNSEGGLLGPEVLLDNGITSPPIPWTDGVDEALLEFDVWRHETLTADSPGMVYRWRVRSTSVDDPTALATAEWRHRDILYYGDPAYVRHHEPVGDLLVTDRRWLQIELGVYEFGQRWGLDGQDATPAPYFDNVALKAWAVDAPLIHVREGDLPQDAFPADGILEYLDLSQNSCRFDMARNISPPQHLRNDPGDSIVCTAATVRDGGFLLGYPRLLVRIRPNPLFNQFRYPPVNPEGIVQFVVQGSPCRDTNGVVVPDRWAFDVPDTGAIWPGDLVHFAFEATDLAGGQVGRASWPADTTGYADFTPESPYPSVATMRGLPTMFSDVPGDQPPVLFWQDFVTGDGLTEWRTAMDNLGMREGVDYERYVTRDPVGGLGNGLGGRAPSAVLEGYGVLLYAGGDHSLFTVGDGDYWGDPSRDLFTLYEWCNRTGGNLLITGDNVVTGMVQSGSLGQWFAGTVLGVVYEEQDVSSSIGGQKAPLVRAIDGNGIIQSVDSWRAFGACPWGRRFDALVPNSNGVVLAEFTDPQGQGGAYPQAAAVLREHPVFGWRCVTLPYAFGAIWEDTDAAGSDPPMAARTRILGDLLQAFGTTPGGPPTDVPVARTLTVNNFPNPFNPATTFEFNLPLSGQVRLKIYDLRGAVVTTLLDEPLPAGAHQAVWRGSDDRGAAVASGVYFYELKAGDETRLGKMTLLK